MEKLLEQPRLAILLGDLLALLEGLEIVLLDRTDRIGSVQASTAFKMQIETSEVEVGGSNRCNNVITDHVFCVHKVNEAKK